MNVYKPRITSPAGNETYHAPSDAVGLGHIAALPASNGGSPSIASSGLSVGSTVVLTAGSTDLCGEVVITTGLVAIGIGMTVTVTFVSPYASRPFLQVSPTTTNAIGIAAGNPTTTGFTITTAVSLAVSSTFKLQYLVTGQPGG